MSQSKERYREFCTKKPLSPLFFNDWWMDAVCGADNWDVVLYEIDNKIVGALPYYKTKKFALFTQIKMPSLTHYLGPLLFYPADIKHSSRTGFEHDAIDHLYANLPPFTFLRNRFTPAIKNWLSLYWKKFKQTTKYTYILDLADLETINKNFKSSVRGKIKKAEGLVSIQHIDDIHVFYTLLDKTFKRQNITNPIHLEWLKGLDKVLSGKEQRKIVIAIDANKNIHSAAYLIWDDSTSYLSMLGEDPDLRNSGAGILLVWELIKYSKNTLHVTKFDFLGSMLKNVEPVRRSFGAEQTEYYEVTKSPFPFI